MRRLFDALGVDYDHWKALTTTALRIDFRASRLGAASFGHAQARAAGLLIGQFVFYSFMGAAIAAGRLVHARPLPGRADRLELRDVHGRDGGAARSQRRNRLAGRPRDSRVPAGHVADVLRGSSRQCPRLHDRDDGGVFVYPDRRVLRPARRGRRHGHHDGHLRRIAPDRAHDDCQLCLARADRRSEPAASCAVVRAVPVELRRVWRVLRAVPRVPGGRHRPALAAEIDVDAAPAASLVRQLSRDRGRADLGPRHRAGRSLRRGARRRHPPSRRQVVARVCRSPGGDHDRGAVPFAQTDRAAGAGVHAVGSARRRVTHSKPVPQRHEIPHGRARDRAVDHRLSPDGHSRTVASGIRSRQAKSTRDCRW